MLESQWLIPLVFVFLCIISEAGETYFKVSGTYF